MTLIQFIAFIPVTVFAAAVWGMALVNIMSLLEISPKRQARARKAYSAWKQSIITMEDQARFCMINHHDTRCVHCTPEDPAVAVELW